MAQPIRDANEHRLLAACVGCGAPVEMRVVFPNIKEATQFRDSLGKTRSPETRQCEFCYATGSYSADDVHVTKPRELKRFDKYRADDRKAVKTRG